MSNTVITTLKTRAVVVLVSVALAFCVGVVLSAYALNYLLIYLGFAG